MNLVYCFKRVNQVNRKQKLHIFVHFIVSHLYQSAEMKVVKVTSKKQDMDFFMNNIIINTVIILTLLPLKTVNFTLWLNTESFLIT